MDSPDQTLLKTPLYQMHVDAGARMVPFAGYSMPVQYPQGVLKEHLHTRSAAGLFDVSHMGQLKITGPGRAQALETLVPGDVCDLPPGRQRYSVFTAADGGILDDLMIANMGEYLFLVVNAACKSADIQHLRKHLPDDVSLEVLEERSLLAVQGPASEEIMLSLGAGVQDMRFMDARELRLLDSDCLVTRSGYTGEDGFEISVPAKAVTGLADVLLGSDKLAWAGLGARDSLRLEAGLCLYGHDLDESITPVMADLGWVIQKSRRPGGSREGGFPGAARIFEQLEKGVRQQRVGLQAEGRAPVREGAVLLDAEGEPVGRVSSGGFGPSVGGPVAMGYIEQGYASIGSIVYTQLRGKKLPMRVCDPVFVAHRYKR